MVHSPPVHSWGSMDSLFLLSEGESLFFKAVAPGELTRLLILRNTGSYKPDSLNALVCFLSLYKPVTRNDSGLEEGLFELQVIGHHCGSQSRR